MNQLFRPPLITGKTPQEQIGEIIRYLRQLSSTLSWLVESGQLAPPTQQENTQNK